METLSSGITRRKKGSGKTECEFCGSTFTIKKNLYRHIRKIHKMQPVKPPHLNYDIKCPVPNCNSGVHIFTGLLKHMYKDHDIPYICEEHKFPTMEAFQKWKCETERKNTCSFTLRHGARKGPSGPRYFYACHRSGRYLPKIRGQRQRMIKTQGSCKMGIMCTAAISVHVNPKEVIVRYYPNHYGHGKETTLIQLSVEEQSAIAESVQKGIPYEKLLDDIRDATSTKDHFQLHLLKKKDYRSINNAYNCDDFNTAISDSDSVDHWISQCCQMENSPILFYRKEEVYTEKGNQEEFILIIMTEFQKHILQTSDRNVICVDSLYRKKGGRFYLTVLFIMDENNLAFPVAFCISNKVDKTVISLFFQSILESAGQLECKFFMSDCETFYYESWKEIMNDESKWLWSMWYVDSRFRIQLRVFRNKLDKRADAYRTMRMLLECQNPTVFQCMLENFIESLKNDPEAKDLGNTVNTYYAPNAEIWAYCHRKEIDLGTNIHLEIMHRTFRYCCREGRKTRLDKFIFVIMKLVRDKMLDRLTAMLDDERSEIALETINQCHNMGVEIDPEHITALSDKTWLVHSENEDENYYVMRENEKCPEHCNLKCSECDICVHMYICNCIHNLINANLCQHIHAVVWHLLTPHFDPPSSPVQLLDTEVSQPAGDSDFIKKLLTKTHSVYKQIQANKCNLNKFTLNALMKRMNECGDICSGKVVEEEETVNKTTVVVPPMAPITNTAPMYIINSMSMKPNESFGNQAQQPFVISNAMPSGGNSTTSQGMGNYYIILPSAPTIPQNTKSSIVQK